MLIQVTTKHGRAFRRAGIEFGPIPTRLWCGEEPPPHKGIRVVSREVLAALEKATGDYGPLHIERDVPLLSGGGELGELFNRVSELEPLEGEVEKLRARTAELAGFEAEADALRTRVAELEPFEQEVAALKVRMAELAPFEGQVEELLARTAEIEQELTRVAELEQELANEKKRTAELEQKLAKAEQGRTRRNRR